MKDLFEQSVKTLFIVTGISASGKSTLAHKLGDMTGYEIFSLDTYKEKVYEQYGFKNEYERKILWNMAKLEFEADIIITMRSKKSIIIEYPFDQSWQEFFDYISKEYDYITVVINCNTRDFEAIWNSRATRDSNFADRPKCLTASAYIKGELYESNQKINDQYKEVKRQEYMNEKYTSIKGNYVYSDKELWKMLEKKEEK